MNETRVYRKVHIRFLWVPHVEQLFGGINLQTEVGHDFEADDGVLALLMGMWNR